MIQTICLHGSKEVVAESKEYFKAADYGSKWYQLVTYECLFCVERFIKRVTEE